MRSRIAVTNNVMVLLEPLDVVRQRQNRGAICRIKNLPISQLANQWLKSRRIGLIGIQDVSPGGGAGALKHLSVTSAQLDRPAMSLP